MDLQKTLASVNIAEDLTEDQLIKIGNQVVEGYDTDLASRKPWEDDLTKWTELALQISSDKTYPWPNAANIKFPLLATAAMQFEARAYPTLVPNNNQIVKCRVIGSDPDGQKVARAERISTHMSYQILDQMDNWEEDMDKLLLILPIAGTCFKKTYWDSAKQRNCSHLVMPKTLVVNYFARCLEDAERVTEIFYQTQRKVKERQNQKIYLDIDLGDPVVSEQDKTTTSINHAFQHSTVEDNTTPHTLLEQHTYLDLDEDGYSEPYIITVDFATKKVLRIVPRFDAEGVNVDEDGKIISIEATQYYTKYDFIPNPDGGFYSIGFGRLLGPINNSANTIINQLVDAGSLSNLQAGFIGKGLRIKMGESRFQPGEWKAVNAIGDDIKKQIFPLPVREPSQVLFSLLDLLLKSGKELASVAEIFTGKMPGQNTPATTTMATIEQGMKVFTAVYKRIYRSLTEEFRKIYKLNQQYLNPEEYIGVLDQKIQQSDYQGSPNDVVPGADPTAVSTQEKQAKVQAVMQILQLGTIDPMWATQLYMDAHEIPGWQQGIKQPTPPPPDPKAEAMKAKAQLDQQKAQMDMQKAQVELQLKAAGAEHDASIKQRVAEQDIRNKQVEAILKAKVAQVELAGKQGQHVQQLKQQAESHGLDMITQAQKHQQDMVHKEKQQTLKKTEKTKHGGNQ